MILCQTRCWIVVLTALAAAGCSTGAGGCIGGRDTAGPLTVEETLGAVFMILKEGGSERFYARANPNAKEAIWKVIQNEELKAYHEYALIVLGYIGDGSDVKKLEKRLKGLEGQLAGYESHAVRALFEAIGLMARRGVKEAQRAAERMTKPEYWEEMRFRWGTQLSFESESIMRFVSFGYAVSGDPELAKKVQAVIERIEDPRERKLLRAALNPKDLLSYAKRVRREESAPVTADDRRQLRSHFNGDLENPGPADP